MTDKPQEWDDVRMGQLYSDTTIPFLKKLYMIRDDMAQEIERLKLALAAATEAAGDAGVIEQAEALYKALAVREHCEICGGDGTHWTLINDEAEPDPCICSIEAMDALTNYQMFRRRQDTSADGTQEVDDAK